MRHHRHIREGCCSRPASPRSNTRAGRPRSSASVSIGPARRPASTGYRPWRFASTATRCPVKPLAPYIIHPARSAIFTHHAATVQNWFTSLAPWPPDLPGTGRLVNASPRVGKSWVSAERLGRSVVTYRGIIRDAGIVAAFDCLPHRLDQPKQPFLILPRHTALADEAAQRDQSDRFDAHLSRCRRVNLGPTAAMTCSLVGVVTWSLPRNRNEGRQSRPQTPE
jgi:hypothetical protein